VRRVELRSKHLHTVQVCFPLSYVLPRKRALANEEISKPNILLGQHITPAKTGTVLSALESSPQLRGPPTPCELNFWSSGYSTIVGPRDFSCIDDQCDGCRVSAPVASG